MASCRKTGTNESIKTLKSSGGDYSNPVTWHAANVSGVNLVTGTISPVLECYIKAGGYALGASLDIAPAASNAEYCTIIRPAAGHGHGMIPGAGVIFTDNDTNQVEIDDVYGQVQDIEIISSGGDATKVDKAGSGFFYFVGCILKTTAANSSAGKAASGGAATSLAFANCLAMGSVRGFETANAGTKVYNCTAVGNGTGLSGLMDATNCIAQDNTTNYSGASLTTCVVDNSVTFVGGGDYHLAAGDTAARGNGTDLSAFFTDDGDGDTRSAWDIGFDEVVNTPPASPTTPSPTDASTIASTTSVTLSCVVYDADGDNLTVTFKDGSDDSTIDTDTVAGGSGTASVTWSGLTPGSTYSWYVTVSDGTDTTTGSMWTFTVAAAGSKIFNFCMDFGLSL